MQLAGLDSIVVAMRESEEESYPTKIRTWTVCTKNRSAAITPWGNIHLSESLYRIILTDSLSSAARPPLSL